MLGLNPSPPRRGMREAALPLLCINPAWRGVPPAAEQATTQPRHTCDARQVSVDRVTVRGSSQGRHSAAGCKMEAGLGVGVSRVCVTKSRSDSYALERHGDVRRGRIILHWSRHREISWRRGRPAHEKRRGGCSRHLPAGLETQNDSHKIPPRIRSARPLRSGEDAVSNLRVPPACILTGTLTR